MTQQLRHIIENASLTNLGYASTARLQPSTYPVAWLRLQHLPQPPPNPRHQYVNYNQKNNQNNNQNTMIELDYYNMFQSCRSAGPRKSELDISTYFNMNSSGMKEEFLDIAYEKDEMVHTSYNNQFDHNGSDYIKAEFEIAAQADYDKIVPFPCLNGYQHKNLSTSNTSAHEDLIVPNMSPAPTVPTAPPRVNEKEEHRPMNKRPRCRSVGDTPYSNQPRPRKSYSVSKSVSPPPKQLQANGKRKCFSQKAKHTCHYCSKQLDTRYKLERHLRTHTGERPFGCEICPARFNQKSSLKTHSNIHAREFIHHEDTRRADVGKKIINSYPLDQLGVPFPIAVFDAIQERRAAGENLDFSSPKPKARKKSR